MPACLLNASEPGHSEKTTEEKLSEILQTRARGAADPPKPTALELLLRRAWLVAGELDGKTFGEREKELERLSAHLKAMHEVHTEMKMTADRRLRPRLRDLVRWPDWPMRSRSRRCRGQ